MRACALDKKGVANWVAHLLRRRTSLRLNLLLRGVLFHVCNMPCVLTA